MNERVSELQHLVPIGVDNPELILEYLHLLDDFTADEVSESDLLNRAKAITENVPAVFAFVEAYRSITGTTFDDLRTGPITATTPPRAFLEWAFFSCGEMRGFLLDKPKHLHSQVFVINHGVQSTCVLAVRDESLGSFLWDSMVFEFDAPALALAAVAVYCEGFAYDVRPREAIPDFGTSECLRESASARLGLFED